MGLDTQMRDYIAIPWPAAPLPSFTDRPTSCAATSPRNTAPLNSAVDGLRRLLLLVWGIGADLPVPVPGIAIAVFLLVVSEFCESSYLIWRRRSLLRHEQLTLEQP
jgi:hypothetical protein